MHADSTEHGPGRGPAPPRSAQRRQHPSLLRSIGAGWRQQQLQQQHQQQARPVPVRQGSAPSSNGSSVLPLNAPRHEQTEDRESQLHPLSPAPALSSAAASRRPVLGLRTHSVNARASGHPLSPRASPRATFRRESGEYSPAGPPPFGFAFSSAAAHGSRPGTGGSSGASPVSAGASASHDQHHHPQQPQPQHQQAARSRALPHARADAGAHAHDAVLDVVDVEVSTQRTLVHIQHELFAPPFARIPSWSGALDGLGAALPTLASLRAAAAAAGAGQAAGAGAGDLEAQRTSAPRASGWQAERDDAEQQQLAKDERAAEAAAAAASASANAAMMQQRWLHSSVNAYVAPAPSPSSAPAASVAYGSSADAACGQALQPQLRFANNSTHTLADPAARAHSHSDVALHPAASTATLLQPRPSADYTVLDHAGSSAHGDADDGAQEGDEGDADEDAAAEKEQEKLEEYVRLLLTRREKFKSGLRGFFKYIRTPMGFFFLAYGISVAVLGSLIFVLFVHWWNPTSVHRGHIIKNLDRTLCSLFGLFALIFTPDRIVSTWRMVHIVRLHKKALRRRKQLGLPPLQDPNDLPRSAAFRAYEAKLDELRIARTRGLEDENAAAKVSEQGDEAAIATQLGKNAGSSEDLRCTSRAQTEHTSVDDVSLLTLEEEKTLVEHQRRFYQAHHYFHYHESITHRAFSLNLMVVIVILLDLHSCTQAVLTGVTWGVHYMHRAAALTASIITVSLSCSILGGILIAIGSNRTKKKEVVERMLREELEEEARKRMRKEEARKRQREREALQQLRAKQAYSTDDLPEEYEKGAGREHRRGSNPLRALLRPQHYRRPSAATTIAADEKEDTDVEADASLNLASNEPPPPVPHLPPHPLAAQTQPGSDGWTALPLGPATAVAAK